MNKFFLLFILNVILLSCARVGSPVGGAKDSIAPRFIGSNIDTARVNVPTDTKELKLYFDEYITLKDIQKNLNISPPIKYKKILPTTMGNKYILVQWDENLQENTTYNFNFGNAISDLNEGNILPYYNFAFSTGNKLDDLYISGDVIDGMAKRVDPNSTTPTENKKNFVVGLYQEKDSIDYTKKPYYITKADPDGYFELNYLSPGKYRILAFEDENQNSVFESGKEAVSFNKEVIDLKESISGMKLVIYPSKKALKYKEMKEATGGAIMIFEGNPENVEVTSLNEKLKEYKITHNPKSDTVNIWFDAVKQDVGIKQSENLKFKYKADGKEGDASLFYRLNPKNEMTGTSVESKIAPTKDFEILWNYPVEKIQSEKWSLKIDSVNTIPFTAKISEDNPNKVLVSANYEIGKKYALSVPKETVSSYYTSNAKSHLFNFEIDKAENYGSFNLTIENKPAAKFWIQFLNEKGEVQFSRFTTEAVHQFKEIKPGKYNLRILVDNNGNGHWDAADFATQTYAEDVYYFPKEIEIRPLWENRETWNLQSNTTDTPTATSPNPSPTPTPTPTPILNSRGLNSKIIKEKL